MTGWCFAEDDACATSQGSASPTEQQFLPQMGDDESEFLDSSDHHRMHTGLSCQCTTTAELDRLYVVITPED